MKTQSIYLCNFVIIYVLTKGLILAVGLSNRAKNSNRSVRPLILETEFKERQFVKALNRAYEGRL